MSTRQEGSKFAQVGEAVRSLRACNAGRKLLVPVKSQALFESVVLMRDSVTVGEAGLEGRKTGIRIRRRQGNGELPSIMTETPMASSFHPRDSTLLVVTPLRTYYPLATVFK